jgi:NADPH-dependent ferric siderophore reductase
MPTDPEPTPRVRRAPPAFRRLTVTRVEPVTPRLTRVTGAGPELAGFPVPEPAASVRILFPSAGTDELVIPEWHANEFLLPDGSKAVIRTLTPVRVDPDRAELDLDIVLHGRGVASEWAARARVGDPLAVSGPARGYTPDPEATAFVIGGDESAIPALRQVLAVIPPTTPVHAFVEVSGPDARTELPDHPHATVEWLDADATNPPGTALANAIMAEPVDADARVWLAGEAAAVQRVRTHLFTEVGFPRAHATIRGYWKHGRVASNADA